MKTEKVLVVGGGFGGIKAAVELAKNGHFHVTLLSDHDSLRFYPTLYRTATGGRRTSSAVPFSEIFKDLRITILIGEAVTLDRKKKQVITSDKKKIDYETLIIGIGVVTNYYGIPGLEKFAYTVKTNESALKLKEHLHHQMIDENKPDMNYLIVGGGPTGIELAGALPLYLSHTMKQHGLKDKSVNVRLIEAAPRLLPNMPKRTSRAVKRRLRKLGVKIHLGRVVQGQTADELMVSGKNMRSHTVIWTAGVTNHPFFTNNHFVMMGHGKVATDIYLQSEQDIFVLGDNANTPYSGQAQTAVRDGAFVAMNLKRRARGLDMKAYKPMRPISVIPVGKRWAAVTYKKLHIHGFLGWLVREIADFIAFKDIETWPAAARQWSEGLNEDDGCPVCNPLNEKT